MGAPWQGALAMVAFTGVVFLILSLSKLREKVAKDVPEALKIGIQAAVGTLIVFIGLRGAGFIVANSSTYIAMGSLKNPRHAADAARHAAHADAGGAPRARRAHHRHRGHHARRLLRAGAATARW